MSGASAGQAMHGLSLLTHLVALHPDTNIRPNLLHLVARHIIAPMEMHPLAICLLNRSIG